jgi:hypothetical protein
VNDKEKEQLAQDRHAARMADMLAPIEGQLDLMEVEVKIKNKQGVVEEWVLRELAGPDRDTFINFSLSRSKVTGGGNVALKDMKGYQAKLISMSLHRKDDDSLMDIETATNLPGSLQGSLFRRAKLISGLDDDAEKREGND